MSICTRFGDFFIGLKKKLKVESYQSTFYLPIIYIDYSPVSSTVLAMQNQNPIYPKTKSLLHQSNLSNSDFAPTDTTNMGAAQQMMQVINSQNILIMKLLQKQKLLYLQLNKNFSGSESSSKTQERGNREAKASGYRQSHQQNQFSDSGSPQNKINDRDNNNKGINQQWANNCPSIRQQAFFEQEINSYSQEGPNKNYVEENHKGKRKQTESKNMIKNFAKSIFRFIRKNKIKRQSILQSIGVDETQFLAFCDHHKARVHSISQLRVLWMPDSSDLKKCFRILSCEYLRKHCLQHTFDSRVQNYPIHLKYRERLLQGLKNPLQFTVMKTN